MKGYFDEQDIVKGRQNKRTKNDHIAFRNVVVPVLKHITVTNRQLLRGGEPSTKQYVSTYFNLFVCFVFGLLILRLTQIGNISLERG